MKKSPFIWDEYSDQPHIITDRNFKKKQKKKFLLEYLQMFLVFIIIFPVSFVWQFLMRYPKSKMQVGIGVNLDKGDIQYDLIEELGAKELLVRMPLWDIERIDDYVDFVKGFGSDKVITINVLQDRPHVEDLDLFRRNISIIFEKFQAISTELQIGSATNRTKWGFFAVSEYLKFYQVAQQVRDEFFSTIKLIGPSVIDFEYYYTAASLFNFKNIKFDKLSSLLYVDRRGAPENRQYGFNFKNKINLLASMVSLSPKTGNEIYITEANWPLKNTAPFAPTSEKECVNEKDYEKYMKSYIKIAKNSQKISKLYWHQLVAPGYGLVDNRDDVVRKTPAFYAFKQLLKNE
ncbi:FIG00388565: hypothetical protein [uncultured Candidatus Thioglobus sp.]|nr:FIG00388565: hypothetical protein [uncultured Candidatus Thioglobus sp.]